MSLTEVRAFGLGVFLTGRGVSVEEELWELLFPFQDRRWSRLELGEYSEKHLRLADAVDPVTTNNDPRPAISPLPPDHLPTRFVLRSRATGKVIGATDPSLMESP